MLKLGESRMQITYPKPFTHHSDIIYPLPSLTPRLPAGAALVLDGRYSYCMGYVVT